MVAGHCQVEGSVAIFIPLRHHLASVAPYELLQTPIIPCVHSSNQSVYMHIAIVICSQSCVLCISFNKESVQGAIISNTVSWAEGRRECDIQVEASGGCCQDWSEVAVV